MVGAFLVIPHTIPHTKQQKQPPCKNPTKQYLVIIIDPVDLGRTVSSDQLSFCRPGSAVRTPATRGVDTDYYLDLHLVATPADDFSHIRRLKPVAI